MLFQLDRNMACQELPVALMARKSLVKSCDAALGSIGWQDIPVMVDCCSAENCNCRLSVSVGEYRVLVVRPVSLVKSVLQRL
jgi:hypothetical protein